LLEAKNSANGHGTVVDHTNASAVGEQTEE
jgi:hypothetical protein